MSNPARAIEEVMQKAVERLDLARAVKPRGVVRRVGDGVAHVAGLDDVGYEELLQFDSGALGMAYDLTEFSTGVILLSHAGHVGEGDGVRGERRLPELPVGPATLGRVLDPLGNPLDEGPALPSHPSLPLFCPAPEIIERKSVDETLWTGIMAIDAAIPIGRGQRELIIGDRNVGKTAVAIDIIAAQQRGDVACVYVVVGQPMSRVLTLQRTLQPTHYQSHGRLAAVAVRELLYTTLHELLLDSLASEHGLRLLAAEAARQWIDETSATVRRQLSASRREAMTQEVLDIVAGSRNRSSIF